MYQITLKKDKNLTKKILTKEYTDEDIEELWDGDYNHLGLGKRCKELEETLKDILEIAIDCDLKTIRDMCNEVINQFKET